MKKLIFRKFTIDTLAFFTSSALIMGLIVWTLQAVNYFDYVTQDGHGLKVYFLYTIFNFPKIIHRILPFIYFISLFYMIISYDLKNELSIFWINGISKLDFANKIIFLSVILMVIQIWIGSFVSPLTQLKAREFLKNSNIDFFTSLIKEGKFINAVRGLTIFIDKKNPDGSYSDIFLDDSTKSTSKMIYAKDGNIVENNKKKIFRLYKGKVINKEESKINIFEFDQIDFNLGNFDANTITMPKIQELSSLTLINCYIPKIQKNDEFECKESLDKEIKQEILKRFYKPLFIPVITILCCFLFLKSRNNINYEKIRKIVFISIFFILIISETSLRYSTSSDFSMTAYLISPWCLFIFLYYMFLKMAKNV